MVDWAISICSKHGSISYNIMNPTSSYLKEELSQRLDTLVQQNQSKLRYELRVKQLSSSDRASPQIRQLRLKGKN